MFTEGAAGEQLPVVCRRDRYNDSKVHAHAISQWLLILPTENFNCAAQRLPIMMNISLHLMCTPLQVLDLSYNHLMGPVPITWLKMTKMKEADLSYNAYFCDEADTSNDRVSGSKFVVCQDEVGRQCRIAVVQWWPRDERPRLAGDWAMQALGTWSKARHGPAYCITCGALCRGAVLRHLLPCHRQWCKILPFWISSS